MITFINLTVAISNGADRSILVNPTTIESIEGYEAAAITGVRLTSGAFHEVREEPKAVQTMTIEALDALFERTLWRSAQVSADVASGLAGH